MTEGTFDAYMWQILENKQKFISQVMTSKSPVRSCEDVDEVSLSYAEVKALATGSPLIKERMDLDMQVARLKLLKANHTNQKYRLEDEIALKYPKQIMNLKAQAEGYEADVQVYKKNRPVNKDGFVMKINGRAFTGRKEAGAALMAGCQWAKGVNTVAFVGEYCGFRLGYSFDMDTCSRSFVLKGQLSHKTEAGEDALGNITRIDHVLENMELELGSIKLWLSDAEKNFEAAKTAAAKPFAQEQELKEKQERLKELDALLAEDKEEKKAPCSRKEEKEGRGEGRISVKEKLAEMKTRISEQAAKGPETARGRENSL